MKKLLIFKCKHCGNVAIKIVDKNVPLYCCGQEMEVLNINTTDGAVEKHMPVVEVSGDKILVKVGEIAHPMTEEHYISHIILETDQGFSLKALMPNVKPEVTFVIGQAEKPLKVLSLCNLHGLWGKEI